MKVKPTALTAHLLPAAALQSDLVVDIPTERLFQPQAELFLAILLREVGEEIFGTICRLNQARENLHVCCSHNFVDANMVMAEAFETLTGLKPDPTDDAQAELWNGAWALATQAMCDQAALMSQPDAPTA